ncbi:hypothetical protein LTR37_020011 [Vermiconidia calcicola]|uniref:Uncharacterized protein n=1 Tax=Vermiconidia calcicola TaxID=1690605 RepID=A0ACC3MDN5_9PEZI|nr:hypothetical protein LTR37_020011 [Vermiconidia calcicola]
MAAPSRSASPGLIEGSSCPTLSSCDSGGGCGPGTVDGGFSGITSGAVSTATGSSGGSGSSPSDSVSGGNDGNTVTMSNGAMSSPAEYGSATPSASPGGSSALSSIRTTHNNGGASPVSTPAGGSTRTNQNNGGGSPTSPGPNTASTGPVCPDYDGQRYTDEQGSTYNIQCNATYTGTIISSSNSTSGMVKRQAGRMTVESCLEYCDQNPECEAISLDCAGTCTLFGDWKDNAV